MHDPVRVLAGRRERALLDLPSVARMADIVARRCREASWIRTLVASLDRFGRLTGCDDLEALLEQARRSPEVAERSLFDLAGALDGHPDAAVAALAMGPKLWFRLGGVAVPWRPLPARSAARRLPEDGWSDDAERVLVLAPIGSGLHLAELLRVRVADVGSLDEEGRLLPDVEAEPLAVRYEQRRGQRPGHPAERITFLSFAARAALLEHLRRRLGDGRGEADGAGAGDAPLIAGSDGGPPSRATIAAARARSNAIIRAGSNLNVDLCRTTGEFFREWGLPGSRFVEVERMHGAPPGDEEPDDLVTASPREGGEPA